MGELQMDEEVSNVGVHDGEEDECLWNHLSYDGHVDVVSGHTHKLLAALELELGTYGVGGDEEDEEHEDARDEHGAEIDVIVYPWVVHRMQLDGDGLQEGFDLPLCETLGAHGGLPHGGSSKGGDGLQVAEEQGSRCERCATIIE